jgi:alkylhydroperoxidase/carboxymuconolactone decarboxylase family protein YurZ
VPPNDPDWSFPFEGRLHEEFPALHDAQSSWLSQIDSLSAPDRKTHELIRLACTVILRNPEGIRRHARLAREVGAEWDEVLGTIMLTTPAFGMLPAVEAMQHARDGFDAAQPPEAD